MCEALSSSYSSSCSPITQNNQPANPPLLPPPPPPHPLILFLARLPPRSVRFVRSSTIDVIITTHNSDQQFLLLLIQIEARGRRCLTPLAPPPRWESLYTSTPREFSAQQALFSRPAKRLFYILHSLTPTSLLWLNKTIFDFRVR